MRWFIQRCQRKDFVKRERYCRVCFYLAGLLILAMGLTLNTKAGLGVSPIISVSYSVSQIFGLNFGNVTMAQYSLFVVVELVLHSLRKGDRDRQGSRMVLVMDLLQIPLSLVFTRFLNLFGALVPDVAAGAASWRENLPVRLAVLVLAILCTGVGASMSLSMRIVPNPGDGIVQAIADWLRKPIGLTKNGFDLANITLTILLGLALAGRVVGVGIGTVVAVVGVGRVMALFQHLAGRKMAALSGMAS